MSSKFLQCINLSGSSLVSRPLVEHRIVRRSLDRLVRFVYHLVDDVLFILVLIVGVVVQKVHLVHQDVLAEGGQSGRQFGRSIAGRLRHAGRRLLAA